MVLVASISLHNPSSKTTAKSNPTYPCDTSKAYCSVDCVSANEGKTTTDLPHESEETGFKLAETGSILMTMSRRSVAAAESSFS